MSIELKIPPLGESITEVQIGEWLKAEGDAVQRDENVVTIESEKATVELPAPADGTLSEILKQNGQPAKVGELIARFEKNGERARPARSPARPRASQKGGEEKAAGEKVRSAPPPERRPKTQPPPTSDMGQVRPERKELQAPPRVTPSARKLLAEHGLRPGDVKATGPGGRLLKEDVQRHLEAAPAEAAPPKAGPGIYPAPPPPAGSREEEVVPMGLLRRTVARRLVEAQHNAALLTTFNEVDVSAVTALRREFGEAFQQRYNARLGFMSFFVKAVIEGLKRVPQLNAEVRGDDIVYHNFFDIGIAIGGEKGLIVPVLRNAERLSFAEIESAIADFARRARENKLMPDELAGGTFTITNGGVFGSLLSTPIVNPPQSGVLGMHAVQERPVAAAGNVVIRPMMYVALTYDHRIVDGREAVTFLRRVREFIEQPARMLIEI